MQNSNTHTHTHHIHLLLTKKKKKRKTNFIREERSSWERGWKMSEEDTFSHPPSLYLLLSLCVCLCVCEIARDKTTSLVQISKISRTSVKVKWSRVAPKWCSSIDLTKRTSWIAETLVRFHFPIPPNNRFLISATLRRVVLRRSWNVSLCAGSGTHWKPAPRSGNPNTDLD